MFTEALSTGCTRFTNLSTSVRDSPDPDAAFPTARPVEELELRLLWVALALLPAPLTLLPRTLWACVFFFGKMMRNLHPLAMTERHLAMEPVSLVAPMGSLSIGSPATGTARSRDSSQLEICLTEISLSSNLHDFSSLER